MRVLRELTDPAHTVILTDYHIYSAHHRLFTDYPVIKIAPGESHKTQATIDHVIHELIKLEAGKDTTLVGVGGGVVTDLAGFAASIYKGEPGSYWRLHPFFAMVDAALGGKNGINTGLYKIQQEQSISQTVSSMISVFTDPAGGRMDQWLCGSDQACLHQGSFAFSNAGTVQFA